jgi:TPP-dependent pyruvate/acetoin dehydrogenase alpha subunit
VIYLCENNGYAITTSVARSHGQLSIAKRADSYGMPGVLVDGQDVEVVYEATREAVERARRGEGPTLIEAKTYRFDEHNVGLIAPGAPYRPTEEIAHHKAHRDPIALFQRALLADGFSQEDLKTIEDQVATAVDEAIVFGEESPAPDPATLDEYMFSQPIPRRHESLGRASVERLTCQP